MSVKDFAKYVIDNLGRASIGNSLNISQKFFGDNAYNIKDFIGFVDEYVASLMSNQKVSCIKGYKIYISGRNAIEKLENTSIKYNEYMIVDDYVMSLWGIINGK